VLHEPGEIHFGSSVERVNVAGRARSAHDAPLRNRLAREDTIVAIFCLGGRVSGWFGGNTECRINRCLGGSLGRRLGIRRSSIFGIHFDDVVVRAMRDLRFQLHFHTTCHLPCHHKRILGREIFFIFPLHDRSPSRTAVYRKAYIVLRVLVRRTGDDDLYSVGGNFSGKGTAVVAVLPFCVELRHGWFRGRCGRRQGRCFGGCFGG